MSRIERLTPQQSARMTEYRDKWMALGLSTARADRVQAEAGIVKAYSIANIPPPKIVWCESPLASAMTRAIIKQSTQGVGDSVRDSIGASVRASVMDSVMDSIGASVKDSFRASVWDSIGASVMDSVWASVRASVMDSARASIGASVMDNVRASVWDSVWASVWDSVWASVKDSFRASVMDSVWDSGYGQHDASWLAFYEYLHDACGLVAQTEKLEGLWMIARSAGWFLPHRGMCWISERHNICKLKDGRIHSEAGPAIAYPDGFAIYALNGVRVPGWLVDTRQADLDPARLMKIDNAEVRREFVRKVGAERIVQALSPGAVDKRIYTTRDGREHPYELHRFQTPGGPWTYLRMVNPSVGLVHFEGVPNECATVQDALNFRNGVKASEVSEDGAAWIQQGDVLMKPLSAKKLKPFPAYLS